MPSPETRTDRALRTGPFLVAGITLAVPVTVGLAAPGFQAGFGALLWLLALVPVFILSYYRGWKGAAVGMASGLVLLAITQAAASVRGGPVSPLLVGVVSAYLVVSLAVGWLAERLHRDRVEVEDLAFTDLLTRLPNRRHARMFLENEFASAQRGRQLTVVLFDLDHFKDYNDNHGHAAGDQALRHFADILGRTTRRMNLSARYGGEEFLTVLNGSDGPGGVAFADRVREALNESEADPAPLTVSAGVAAYHPTMQSIDEILAAADHALYQAKRAGRDCIRLFGRSTGPGSVVGSEDGADASDSSSPAGGDGRPAEPVRDRRQPPTRSGRRVLLVEDDESVRSLIRTYLTREGFTVTEAGDANAAVLELRSEFDILVTDIRLPGATGTELVASLKSRWPATQAIVITGLKDAQVAAEALNAGADRYLFKPFGMRELGAHLQDALVRRDRVLADRRERRRLTTEARERKEQARQAVLRGARALVRAVEVRDPYTRGHSMRVSGYAEVLARAYDPDGQQVDRDSLRLACELHDVGKIGIPDAILNKDGRLTDEEFREVFRHPSTGRRILEPLLDDETILAVVSWHHERWDGSGYPDGLAAEAIPLPARIVALADALDAMTSTRAYRRALPWDLAVSQIRELFGQQFDPGLREAFEEAIPTLQELVASDAA